MIGEVFIRIKVRDNEFDTLGPFPNEAVALAELRKRPRAHIPKNGFLEATVLPVSREVKLGHDGSVQDA